MSGHTGYSLVFKKQISGREVDPPLSYPLKFFYASLREAAIKQVLLLMTGPLRPNPHPPSSLMAVEILERWKKKFQESSFFLNGPALYPPPPS